MLREQVAEIIREYSDKEYLWSEENGEKPNSNNYAAQILNLFKAEVDKLTVIDDGEIKRDER